MKKIMYICLIIISASIFALSQNGWVHICSFSEDITSICFIDSLKGLAGTGSFASTNKMLKTTDAGYSWTDLLQTNYSIHNIYFYNQEIGFVVCDSGKIYKSSDGGINWSLYSLQETDHIINIYFLNEALGWACLGTDRIIRTTDGGETWFSSITPDAIANRDVEFIDENIGYVVGHNNYFAKSTDGGITWFQIEAPIQSSLFDIEFFDNETGLIIGGNQIAKTNDGGESWNIVQITNGIQLNSVSTFASKYAWVVGAGALIYYSSDAGSTWVTQSITPPSGLLKVHSIDSVNVWSLGYYKLYRTTSGGILNVYSVTNINQKNFILFQNYPNPFNPSTIICFQLPEASKVTLKIYDILGNEVRQLINEYKSAGFYTTEFNIESIIEKKASGIYFYQLRVSEQTSILRNDFLATKKMVYLK